MSRLRSHQHAAFGEMLALLDRIELDPDALNGVHSQTLAGLMDAACPEEDDLLAMNAELQEWVRWRRGPAYFLAWALQGVTSRRHSPLHIEASLRYSDALIGIASDDSLLVLEVAWRTLRSLQDLLEGAVRTQADREAMSSQLGGWRDLILGRLSVHHRFYSAWSDPAAHREMNPVVEHLYGRRTWGSLVTAYPEVGVTPQGLGRVEVLERVVAACEEAGNAYHWLIARRYLAAQSCDLGRRDVGMAELRATIDDAVALGLEAEIGQLLRLLALQHAVVGDGHSAVETLSQALDFERPLHLFWYWYGLTLREWADLRIPLVKSGGTFDEIDHALEAYRLGRILMDERLGNTGTPVARAVKRQAWAFSTERAVTFALLRGYPREALAEIEASGPRDVVHTLAEMRATQDLPGSDIQEFRESRAVFHRHLTTVPSAFDEYVESIADEYDLRRRYLTGRDSLKAGILSLTSDKVVASLFEHVGEDRLVLVLFVAENGKSTAVLVDLKDGSTLSESFPATGPDVRDVVEAYEDELARAGELPDPGPATRSALDGLMGSLATLLGPVLVTAGEAAQDRPLTVVPRTELNLVPFHALPFDGGRTLLDEAAEVTIVPSLAVLVDLMRRRSAGPDRRDVLALYDPAGAPLLDGAFGSAGRGAELRIMTDAGPQEVLRTLSDVADVDLVLACHGEFDPDLPSASVLHLGAGRLLTLADLAAGVSLSHCRSVILIACESGMVRAGIGSEYLGLPGVLLSAGVPTAVGTLWEVNQLATSILLANFLEGLTEDASIARVLRTAQRHLREVSRAEVEEWVDRRLPTKAELILPLVARMQDSPFQHPDYWAGFYAAGV